MDIPTAWKEIDVSSLSGILMVLGEPDVGKEHLLPVSLPAALLGRVPRRLPGWRPGAEHPGTPMHHDTGPAP